MIILIAGGLVGGGLVVGGWWVVGGIGWCVVGVWWAGSFSRSTCSANVRMKCVGPSARTGVGQSSLTLCVGPDTARPWRWFPCAALFGSAR